MAIKVKFNIGHVHILTFEAMEEIPRLHETVTLEGENNSEMRCIVRDVQHRLISPFEREVIITLQLIKTEIPDDEQEQTDGK